MPLGGAETLILQHLKNLDRNEFEVHFISLACKGILKHKMKEKTDYYKCLNKKFILDPIAILKLRKYLIYNSIDLVHSHDWISSLYLLIASKGLKIKKITTIHSQGKGWRDYITSYILKQYDHIICVSRYQKLNLFEKGILWSKMEVIYNCFDFEKFKKTFISKDYEKDKVFRIVMVGNYYWQKDQQTLIEAINIVRNQGYNIELHLVGGRNIELFEQCQILVNNLNLNAVVHFHNHKRVDNNFLSKFDLFILSSKSERFPIAPLEAMACGLPVLVSDITPNMEIIRFGKDGFYFEAGNPGSCAEEIIRVVNNPVLLHTMGKKAYQRSKEFQPKIIVNELEHKYKDLMYEKFQ